MSERPFFLTRKEALPALERWLRGREYNCGGYSGRRDKNGNAMIGLGWDWDPDNDWKLPDKRGLIVVTNDDLLAEADELVKRRMRP